jgi:autotransporter-associated beta strand protein
MARVALFCALAYFCTRAAAFDQHFDYTSFDTNFKQAQFDVLNYPSVNGNFMMTSTDNHRPEMVANGNALAEFYNNFNADYNHPTAERRTPADEAAFINTYVLTNSTKNGPRPDWLILNEISASQWQLNPGPPSLSEHRTWVIDTVTLLNDVYGYKVVTYSPYATVGTANSESWQALAAKSYIGVESYQSGPEVWNSGADYASRLAWAQAQYQDSKDTYLAAGVPESRIFLGEHFGNNAAITSSGTTATWGRAGLASAADWDTVIQIRQDAIYNVGFAGFLAYDWGGNGMGVTQAEQIQHEYYYRSRLVLPGQKPQWLSDSAINVNGTTIPLSWSQPLNWLGGVQNAPGAEVNFWRTLTAARTITLDGNKTVGTMTFDSPYSYTISPGSGGSLIFDNGVGAAKVAANQGNHTIGVNVQLAKDLNFTTNFGTFTVSGNVNGAGGLTKSGVTTLQLNGVNSYTGATNVAAGTLRMPNGLSGDGGGVTVASLARLEGGGRISRSVVNNGVLAGPSSPAVLTLSEPVSGAGQFTGNMLVLDSFSPGNNGPAAVSAGSVTFAATAKLLIEVGGTTAGLQYDALAFSGAATLGGTLQVALANGFTPGPGDRFTLLTGGSVAGSFALTALPVAPHLTFSVICNPTSVVLAVSPSLSGDYNADGRVDGVDFSIWQRTLGSTTQLAADGNGNGVIDAGDYRVWQGNVGATASSAASISVPEPATIVLGLVLIAFATSIHRRIKTPR